jgi:TRAP-type C4-dicarboxylate transport system permease small subunit
LRDSYLGWITAGLNAVGTALIFGLLVLLNFDIAGRALFDAPFAGVPELVALSFVAIVFLQLPHAVRLGRLTVADTLFGRFAAAYPRAACGVRALYNLVGAVTFAVVIHASWPLFERAWTDGFFVGSIGNFTAPTWPTKLVILIGSAAVTLQFLILAIHEIRGAAARGGDGA